MSEPQVIEIEVLEADFEAFVERAAHGERFIIAKGEVRYAFISADEWLAAQVVE